MFFHVGVLMVIFNVKEDNKQYCLKVLSQHHLFRFITIY